MVKAVVSKLIGVSQSLSSRNLTVFLPLPKGSKMSNSIVTVYPVAALVVVCGHALHGIWTPDPCVRAVAPHSAVAAC